jgi:hypothetical protein
LLEYSFALGYSSRALRYCLECVFESSKVSVLEANEKVRAMPLPEEAKEKMLLKATEGLSFLINP